MIKHQQWSYRAQAAAPFSGAAVERSSLLQSTTMWGLIGMLVLLPVRAVELPLHMAPVELWNMLMLPFFWLYILEKRHHIQLPYAAALWLILLGSFIGTFAAPIPSASITVIVKEVYLFVWFITLVAVFTCLPTPALRRVMRVWFAVVAAHGVLVIAQFLFPGFFHAMIAVVSRFGTLDPYRPSGLFENANSTALFQMMGFAPALLMGKLSKRSLIPCIFIFFTILATGSMAATMGSLCGFAAAIVVIGTIGNRPKLAINIVIPIVAVAVLLGGTLALVISQSAEYQQRFAYIFYGRAEGSAGGRFILWQRGIELLASGSTIFGIGPESFRSVDRSGTQLHNDLLSFLIERGLIGTAGFLLLAAQTLLKGATMLLLHRQHPTEIGLAGAILFAVLTGAMVHSQFHQVFHDRAIWLVLALQEAVLLGYIAVSQKANQERTRAAKPLLRSL